MLEMLLFMYVCIYLSIYLFMHLLNVSWNFLFPKQKSRNSYTFKIISFPHTLSPIVYDQIDNLRVNFKKTETLKGKGVGGGYSTR